MSVFVFGTGRRHEAEMMPAPAGGAIPQVGGPPRLWTLYAQWSSRSDFLNDTWVSTDADALEAFARARGFKHYRITEARRDLTAVSGTPGNLSVWNLRPFHPHWGERGGRSYQSQDWIIERLYESGVETLADVERLSQDRLREIFADQPVRGLMEELLSRAAEVRDEAAREAA